MSITDIDERFEVAKLLLPNKNISANSKGYKKLIEKSHLHGKERFGILYKKEIDDNISDEEKSELQQIRTGKGLILMRGENNISFTRDEAEELMNNGVVGIFGFLKNKLEKYKDLEINYYIEDFFGEEIDNDFKKEIGGLKEEDLSILKEIIGVDINNIKNDYNLNFLKEKNDLINNNIIKSKIFERIKLIEEEFAKIKSELKQIENKNIGNGKKVEKISKLIEDNYTLISSKIGYRFLKLLKDRELFFNNQIFNGKYEEVFNILTRTGGTESNVIIGINEQKILELFKTKEYSNFEYIDIKELNLDNLNKDKHYIITGVNSLSSIDVSEYGGNGIAWNLRSRLANQEISGYTIISEKGNYEDLIRYHSAFVNSTKNIVGNKNIEWISSLSNNENYKKLMKIDILKRFINEFSYLEEVRDYIDYLLKNKIDDINGDQLFLKDLEKNFKKDFNYIFPGYLKGIILDYEDEN